MDSAEAVMVSVTDPLVPPAIRVNSPVAATADAGIAFWPAFQRVCNQVTFLPSQAVRNDSGVAPRPRSVRKLRAS